MKCLVSLLARTCMGTLALLAVMTICAPSNLTAQESNAKKEDKLYELRIYTANPGKLADLNARFRDHTLKLFEKHGIENIAYWTVSEGARSDGSDKDNMLVYIIAHKNKEAADTSWAAFQADPVWQAARAKSEENGKLLAKPPVSIFMKPTDFSPPDGPVNKDSKDPPRIFELRQYNVGAEGVPGTVDRFKAGEKDLFTKAGMQTLNFWTSDNAFIYLLAHKDREAARASWQSFGPEFQKFMAEYRAQAAAPRGGRGGGGGSDIRYLVPTDYSPRK